MRLPDDDDPPLHPIQESLGFCAAVMIALRRFFRPAHRGTRDQEMAVDENEPLHPPATKNRFRLAPFPVND